MVTPTFSRAVNGPSRSLTELNVVSPDVWVATTLSAANARSASNSGKRGLPGGGATTSGTSWAGVVIGAAAYASARARLRASARPHRLRRTRRAGRLCDPQPRLHGAGRLAHVPSRGRLRRRRPGLPQHLRR